MLRGGSLIGAIVKEKWSKENKRKTWTVGWFHG